MTYLVDLRKRRKIENQITPLKKKLLRSDQNKLILKQTAVASTEKTAFNSVKNQIETTKKITWEALSFYFNPQKRYLALMVIALLCGAGALLFYNKDTLTAIFLVLSSLVLILYSNKKPTLSKIIINESGVSVDNMVYYYRDLESFWIDYNPGSTKELSLESKKWYLPYIKVAMENNDPVQIRDLMINFLPEREHENSIVDFIGKKLGL